MMKRIVYIAFVLLAITGCKQNNYLDWKALNEAWLENNKKDTTVVTTASGLQYKKLNPGPNPTESRPNYSNTVLVDYKLYLVSSYGGYKIGDVLQEGTSASFSMSSVVAGFAEGLHLMRVHDDFMLFIPYSLGYGAEPVGTEGNYGYIPPYSTLVYEVHLKAIMQ